MGTAVILNLRQAETFVKQRVAAERVVSFCPSATHFLQKQKFHVIPSATLHGGLSHAKTVVRIDRDLPRIVDAAAAQYALDYPEATGLRVHLYYYLSRVYYLYFSLRSLRHSGGEFFWVEKKTLARGGWNAMFSALGAQPIGYMASYAYTHYSVVHYLLATLYNYIITLCIRRKAHLKVIDFGDELPKRILIAMMENGDHPLVLNTKKLGKNPLLTTRFFLKSLSRLARARPDGKPVIIFRAMPPQHYKATVETFRIPPLANDAVTEVMRRAVENYIPFVRTEAAMGRKIVRSVRPDIAVSDHAQYCYILGGLEELSAYGGKHAMLNHGTHTMQYTPVSKLAVRLWSGQERVINRNTTHSLPKSPLTEMLVRELRPTGGYQTTKLNAYGKITHKPAADGPFVILHAGNYTDAYNHIPWCTETASEYLMAMVELLEEVAKLDNVELIIKLKNRKAGPHKEIVEEHIRRLGVEGKVRVDVAGKFSKLMARSHLVVGNLSGTIEEALANHIPLMIHTYRKNYFHIAEHTANAAAIGNAAPAYLVKERADIGRIITRLDAQRSALSNPALYANVAWQENELTSIHDFAKDLVASARKTRDNHAG
ncbi:MAG: hypothetical protein SFX19_07200 [Alphaproteobacteria bacterium]|nr:hypothetical protein [Alphaproteobacteria bacterium]